MQIQGHYELKFEAVREAFAALFDDPQERGAALCIQIGGETVVDLWSGTADKDGAEAWHSDTIANLFSCTKMFTAVTALQLVGEGKLALDVPVARYWPEFAQAEKQAITLRQLLSHRAGTRASRADARRGFLRLANHGSGAGCRGALVDAWYCSWLCGYHLWMADR